jgi:hypothetical protein
VFENRVPKIIFGPKRDDITGEWRRLFNVGLYGLYAPNIIRVIRSRAMRWAGHVARIRERRAVYRILVGKPDGTRQFGCSSVGCRVILKWIFK